MGTASGLALQRQLPRQGLKIGQFRCLAGGATMHSGPTSVLHVNTWQATQPSWWKAGLSDFGLIICMLPRCFSQFACIQEAVCPELHRMLSCCSLVPLFAMRHSCAYISESRHDGGVWFSWECDGPAGPPLSGWAESGWTPRDNDCVIRSQAHTVQLSSPVFLALRPRRVGQGLGFRLSQDHQPTHFTSLMHGVDH